MNYLIKYLFHNYPQSPLDTRTIQRWFDDDDDGDDISACAAHRATFSVAFARTSSRTAALLSCCNVSCSTRILCAVLDVALSGDFNLLPWLLTSLSASEKSCYIYDQCVSKVLVSVKVMHHKWLYLRSGCKSKY